MSDEMQNAPAVLAGGLILPTRGEIEARGKEVKEYIEAINDFIASMMKKGIDFGVIPGTEKKDKQGNVLPDDQQTPTIYKPGVQKLDLLFSMVPNYTETHRELDLDRAWFYVEYQVDMTRGGAKVAEGRGCAHSLETKWGFRFAARKCPKCGEPTVIRSKRGPGWFCWEKKGGCGANFPDDNDPEIANQEVGRIENEAWADQINTIVKVAMLRAHREATLSATALSNRFTQDVGEEPPDETGEKPHTDEQESGPALGLECVTAALAGQKITKANAQMAAHALKFPTDLGKLTEAQLNQVIAKAKEK